MSEYVIPPWCEVLMKPIVEVRDTFYMVSDKYPLAEKMNKFLKEHVETANWVAEVKYSKEFQCKMCRNICEVILDDNNEVRTCSICGKGNTEYAVSVLLESGKKNG